MSASVLVVEDDDGIALPLIRTLEREGYSVERCDIGQAAIEKIAVDQVDLVILDLGLPDMDGLDVCRRVRVNGYDGAILILTARGGELDRVVGLDVGADDYVAKPFALAELLARARALLRRSGPARVEPNGLAPSSALANVGVRLDPAARRVWQGDEEIALTSKEFDLLSLLLDNLDTVVTRERLMDDVWDENWFGSTKTLDVTVGRLRQKLVAAQSASRIVAVRGVGFRLEVSASDA
ncbi:MAG: response regulator transcription factor [Salinibacterium sp.]|nr:response regulator transcription factor [Salinibacterium sp.]